MGLQERKHAKVVPLYEKVLSKLLEKVVQLQVVIYLEKSNFFHSGQYSFRRRHSTQSAITLSRDTMRKNMDNGFLTETRFVESKTFKTLDHGKLLEKLKPLSTACKADRWISDDHSSLNASVFIYGILSDAQPVLLGVQQTSFLQPILFSLYIADLPNCFKAARSLIDDTGIYVIAPTMSKLTVLLNTDLVNFLKFSSFN